MNTTYFLYNNKDKKIYYSVNELNLSHSRIAEMYKLDEDKCLKLVVYRSESSNAFGIRDLRISNVYDGEELPFSPSKQDLDVLEKFVKRKFLTKKDSYLNKFEKGLTNAMYMNTSLPNRNYVKEDAMETKVNNMNDWMMAGLLDNIINLESGIFTYAE